MYKTVADVMAARGLSREKLKEWREKKYSVSGVDKAAEIIKAAIAKNEQITVVGDYDVDGISATAIMFYLLNYGMKYTKVKLRLPKRFTEGYGLSEKIIDEIDSGLVITVDNGIAAIPAIKKAKEKGLTVIVTDHHLASPAGLPEADLIIDPNAIPGQADWNGYCGAGLAYKIACQMVPNSYYLQKMLSLACVATIADSVPLLEDNRNIVVDGLAALKTVTGVPQGLRSLLEKKNLTGHITEEDIGFTIAPCLNAPGRLEDAGAVQSLNLFISFKSREESDEDAEALIEMNEKRKLLTEEAMVKLEEAIYEGGLADHGVIVAQADFISDGLLGLCAGKLAEKYKMPTMIFGPIEGGFCKGSVRTYGDFNIKEFLDEVAADLSADEVIRQYGGHAAAAGISVWDGKFEKFQKHVFSKGVSVPEIDIKPDIICENREVPRYIEELKEFAPFGQANPAIVFHIKNFTCEPIKTAMYAVLKEKHLKVKSIVSEALWFDGVEPFKAYGEPKEFDILGMLSENYFNGNVTPSIEVVNIFPIIRKENDFLSAMKRMSKGR